MIDLNTAGTQRRKRQAPSEAPADPVLALRQKMAEYDLNPGDLVGDGKLHRFKTGKRNDLSGWYVFHSNGISGAAFGDWSTGIKETWCSQDTSILSDEDAKKHYERIRQATEMRKAEEEKNHARASERATERLKNGTTDINHPYIESKGIKPLPGMVQENGLLLIPIKDSDNKVWSVQEIRSDGTKKFPFGSKIEGNSFTIMGNGDLMICEGVATGATVHEATGATVVVAFNRVNLKAVAKRVRERCPADTITICADNDQFTPGNPGMTDGEKAAQSIGANLCFPSFSDLDGKPTDFNDLAQREGIEAVKGQISQPGNRPAFPAMREDRSRVAGRVTEAPEPIEYIFLYEDQGLIPRGVVGVICATGGTGKTFWLLSLAYAGAEGGSFGPISSPNPVKTLVLVAEDPQDELDRRLWAIGKGKFPHDLHAGSIYGEVGPLMRLDGGVPVRADGFYWLESTIKNHSGLELLILDPKSRLFGLDENNNDHCTQWIQSIEYLAKKYNLTILFSHHTSKGEAGKITQNMGRGGSAIVDGCRWQAGLVRLEQKPAEKFGISDFRNYIIFDAPKSNYAADLPGQIYFKRSQNGSLFHVDPVHEKTKQIGAKLVSLLKDDPVKYTTHELEKGAKGQDIYKEIKKDVPSFDRTNETKVVVDYLIRKEILYEAIDDSNPKGRPKTVLFVKD